MKRSLHSIVHQSSSVPTITLLMASALFGVQTASADGAGNADVLTEQVCMQDAAGFGLGCTANDVSLATATNIEILDDGCQFPGDEVTFTANFEVLLTAQERHDVGIWFASDGDGNSDGALTGQCTVVTPAYAPDPPWLDIDVTSDDPNGVTQDTCGDINDAHNPLFPSITLTVTCIDPDGDGRLNLPYCTSWRQPGANELCTSPLQAFPGAPSKCKCDTGFTLDIPVPYSGTVEVIKELVPAASPGAFNLQVDGVDQAVDAGHLGTTGPVTVSAGISTDPEPIGDTHTVGETAGSNTDLADFDTTINCLDEDNDTVSGDNTGPLDVFVEPDDAWVCTVTNTLKITDLSISKSDDPDPVQAGATLTYTVTVDNIGLIPAENVVVTESLPTGVTFVSTTGCANDPNGVPECSLGTISAGGSASYTVSVTVNGDVADQTVLTNTVSVSSDTPDENPANDTATEDTTVLNNPALSIVKTASPTTYDSVGDVIGYSYLVTNTGNVTISNLAVTDDNVDAPATCDATTLAPEASTTCSAQRTVAQADIDDGSITNVAFASGTDTNGGDVISPNDDETVTADQNPALSIVKTGEFNDENGDGFADAGETISYSFTVTNTGNVTLTDVSISDPGVSISGGPIDLLSPGATDGSTFTGTYTIMQADVDSGTFYNLATACGDDPSEVAICDDDDHEEPLPQNPVISITKSPDEQTIAQGTTANFTIVVSNDGNVTLTNVIVADPLAPECGRQFASIAVGSSEQYSCAVNNVTTDFTNVATANSAEAGPVSDWAGVIVIPVVEFCENNSPPDALLMQYSGLDPSVYIVVEHPQDGVIYSGTVADGGSFILQREDDGGNFQLNPELDAYIYDAQGGNLIDRIDIHTSCSMPLFLGQTYGTDLEVAKLTLLGEAVFGGDPDAIEPDDILWRNMATGENRLYEMDGWEIVSIREIQNVSDLNWEIVGRGDYNGGGESDILWRNSVTGRNWMYLMNGSTIISSQPINTESDLNWKIVGSGDYNGDGQSDILWRHSVTGRNWMYLMNGAVIDASFPVNTESDMNWKIVGSGDYNGDGKSDILWRHGVTGRNWVYLMNGPVIDASLPVNTENDLNWKIVGSGDYNGDGKSDILWRNSVTGRNWMYLMNGGTIISSQPINTEGDLDWKIVGSGDYNGDGKSDILWRHSVTGRNWMYLMNGAVIDASFPVNTESDLDWTVIYTN